MRIGRINFAQASRCAGVIQTIEQITFGTIAEVIGICSFQYMQPDVSHMMNMVILAIARLLGVVSMLMASFETTSKRIPVIHLKPCLVPVPG